ncbi:hypothetical protein CPLU01_05236 [Colletotrichum plurivorum]|uniref:Uncharacterized protein n=1 Tax=Colletotrichum plurivorum TaxID=2175906 RepID=A0A8H6NIP9_9PEZI|nr:hypothetical protein CPLU01_05236 [Colletotrichum plurivorum]
MALAVALATKARRAERNSTTTATTDGNDDDEKGGEVEAGECSEGKEGGCKGGGYEGEENGAVGVGEERSLRAFEMTMSFVAETRARAMLLSCLDVIHVGIEAREKKSAKIRQRGTQTP